MSTATGKKNDGKSYLAKTGELDAKWHLVDATDLVLGRMATRIAHILQGKHKPTYTPHVDTGDYVIVVNAEKITVTGDKRQSLTYETYSGHPSGRRVYTFEDMNTRAPEKVIELAVKRMMPKTSLGKSMLKKLKVYKGGTHEHAAQRPTKLEL
ncbi:MAG: 50S ribosomal protein L13 [Planctomycetota bacterium]